MKRLIPLFLLASTTLVYALRTNTPVDVTPANAKALGISVELSIDPKRPAPNYGITSEGTNTRVVVTVKTGKDWSMFQPTLVVNNKDGLLVYTPMGHGAWRTGHLWISDILVRSNLLIHTSIIFDNMLSSPQPYRIHLKDWMKESEQPDGAVTQEPARSAAP